MFGIFKVYAEAHFCLNFLVNAFAMLKAETDCLLRECRKQMAVCKVYPEGIC